MTEKNHPRKGQTIDQAVQVPVGNTPEQKAENARLLNQAAADAPAEKRTADEILRRNQDTDKDIIAKQNADAKKAQELIAEQGKVDRADNDIMAIGQAKDTIDYINKHPTTNPKSDAKAIKVQEKIEAQALADLQKAVPELDSKGRQTVGEFAKKQGVELDFLNDAKPAGTGKLTPDQPAAPAPAATTPAPAPAQPAPVPPVAAPRPNGL